MVTAICSQCGESFSLRDEVAGQQAKCRCGAVVAIPAFSGDPPLAPPERAYTRGETRPSRGGRWLNLAAIIFAAVFVVIFAHYKFVYAPEMRHIKEELRSAANPDPIIPRQQNQTAAPESHDLATQQPKTQELKNHDAVDTEALKAFLSSCNDYVRACAAFDDAMKNDVDSTDVSELIKRETAINDKLDGLFLPAKAVQKAHDQIPKELDDTDVRRSIADVMLAGANEVLQFDKTHLTIELALTNAHVNVANGKRIFEVDPKIAENNYTAMLNTLVDATTSCDAIVKTLGDKHIFPTTLAQATSLPSEPGTVSGQSANGVTSPDAALSNLLGNLDLSTATIAGQWSLTNGVLSRTDPGFATLELRRKPPAEYDYTVVFEIEKDKEGIQMICCGKGHQFSWILGSTNCGFSFVDGKNAGENVTTNNQVHIALGQDHTTTVKVRQDGIEAYLDGKLVSSLKTDFSNLTLNPHHRLHHKDAIGLGASGQGVVFRSAQVLPFGAG